MSTITQEQLTQKILQINKIQTQKLNEKLPYLLNSELVDRFERLEQIEHLFNALNCLINCFDKEI